VLELQTESPEVMCDERLSQQREAFFDEAESAFLIFDEHLFLLDVNAAYLQEKRIKKDAIIGKHISSVFSGQLDSERLEKYREVLQTGEAFYVEEMKSHPLRGTYFLQTKAFSSGTGLGIAQKIVHPQKETAHDVETFIYKSSHELRGPLARILGVLNLSENMVNDVHDAKHFFTIIKQQAEHLDVILRTLVQSTDVRKTTADRDAVDFWNLVESVLSELTNQPGFHDVRFEKMVSFSNPFFNDTKLLHSLLFQLIENAIKFRKQDGSSAIIKISVREEEAGARIVIDDNGIGIPLTIQDKVFQLFYRSEQKHKGSGLGLYAVRQLVKKMSGALSLKSESGKGCQFSIFIPSQQSLKASA
jgi:signal transduction histidine kinase